MVRLLADAHCADQYRKRMGRVHPRLGNGTLAGALVRIDRAPDVSVGAGQFLETMAAVIDAVLKWRERQNMKS